jgi:hypothetical protein
MKIPSLLILFYFLSLNNNFSQTINLNGYYQGKNLIVQNPFISTGVGFCVFEVLVNGQTTTDEINSNEFDIDLSNLKLHQGQKINVKIKFKKGCLPKVLNSEVIKAKSTFTLNSIEIDEKNSMLKWSTKDENGELPYIVQQFKWNKWTSIKEVQGTGKSDDNSYLCSILFHSGENRFRLKQVDFTNIPRYSKEIAAKINLPPVTFKINKVKKIISFSAKTDYEIFDLNGKIIFMGSASEINLAKLNKGKYYLNYDNTMTEFMQ